MPCRTLSICRQATSPSVYLWITDDILTEAWNRFARVSSAASKRRCGGRRYGSNVPGPLEAHRRLSKRRMGVAAVATGGPSIGADLGALFGIGSFKPEQRIDGWKWEAPQLDRRKAKETKTENGWFGSATSKEKKAWDSFLQPPACQENAHNVEAAVKAKEQAIEQSRAAFSALLSGRVHLQRVGKHDLVEVLDFLQSAADEPKAGNLVTLLQWLMDKNVSDDAVSAIALIVKGKVELGTCGDNLASILAALLQYLDPKTICDNIASIFHSIKNESFGDICVGTTRALFNATSATSGADRQAPIVAVKVWLDCLRACEQLNVWHSDSPVWQDIYAVLAQHIQKPSVLARHFLTLHRLDLSRILLRHWAGTAKSEHMPGDSQDEVTISIIGSNKNLNLRRTLDGVDMAAVLGDFDAMRAARYDRRKERLQTSSPFVDMLDVARRHALRHDWLCEELFDILMHSSSATSVQKVSWELRCHRDLGLTLRTAQRLIHYFLRHDRIQFAHSLFRAVPTLSLLHVHDLPIKLAHAGTIGSTAMWQVLQRQIKEDFVDVQDRCPQSPGLTITQEHVDLIHLVAHAFASSPAITPRVAFRRVWQCYLFLRDRRAPMNPLLTRALVQAGVTRPLQALQRPSTEKLRYILHLVARIEGTEVAENLDRTVYRYWTERVKPRIIHLSRRIDFALGISKDAMVEKRAAWYNLRKWSRAHRPWLLPGRPGCSQTPRLASAGKSSPKSISPSNSLDPWSVDGPETPASTSMELPNDVRKAAMFTDYVPFPAVTEEPQEQSGPTPAIAVSRQQDTTSVEPDLITNIAPRQGLGYSIPQSNKSAAELPVHHVGTEVETVPAMVAQVKTDAMLGSSDAADILSSDPTNITDVTHQQGADSSLVSVVMAEHAMDSLDVQGTEQFGGKGTMAVSEAKSARLLQKRLPLNPRQHEVCKLCLPRSATITQGAEQRYLEDGPWCNPSSALTALPSESLVGIPRAVSKDVKHGKLEPLSTEEKESLELHRICVRRRQLGHRAGDVRCPGNTWEPSSPQSAPPSQPDCEYLEWRQDPSGRYTLFIETDNEWRRYSHVQGMVRQIRRWAKKTGRAHTEREAKSLEKWEVAQEEMAKREATLHGVPRSTVLPS